MSIVSFKEHLGAFANIKQDFYKKIDKIVKKGLIIACVFMNVLEIGEFVSSGVVNDLKNAHRIEFLEAFLKGDPGLLRSLIFNDGLV